MPYQIKVTSAAIAGIASHWGYFIHREHHKSAPTLAWIYVVLAITIYLHELLFYDFSTLPAFRDSFAFIAAYAGALCTSMSIYRVFFHRTRSFRGPFLCRVTKLWHSWQVRDGTNHLYLESLHRKYGTFVRTGPAEITVFTAAGLEAVDGPGNTCIRGNWADAFHPDLNIISMRDQRHHDNRRRIWNYAFSVKVALALKSFENRLIRHGEHMDQYLQSADGQAVSCNDIFTYYAFDLMGDLSFGKSYDMLNGGKWPDSILRMRQFMPFFGPMNQSTWLINLGLGLPGCSTDWKAFVLYCKQIMKERIEISSYLIEGSIKNDTLEQDRHDLENDAVALIHAGRRPKPSLILHLDSDTTASALIYIFYHLATLPIYQKQIRTELKAISSIANIAELQQLPILSSFIMETLRLFPPAPTVFPRISPNKGVTIEGTYIPPNTTIVTPRYCIVRLESSFEQPRDFIPERWTTKPWMVRDKRAWVPFSQANNIATGRYSCVAKDWAMKNLTYVTALLVSKYDISLPPGENGMEVWKDMKDFVTAAPGKLNLVFTKYEEF
ncbi:hypothetical protein HYFRA_00006233 [Hymenoscyphus fraxineus]|uniref:Cytochrome P450 n=1 Tax=Hymenoscyphus fraxineus TaxID=746836 RepID=A0A9N9LBZ1_9HELO|nr:hypothetical protein HYFRA_00006233 [Hymenoscyphus fraxineus]